MAAEVEAVAVADLGLGEAADLVLGLEDDHRPALLGEEVAGGQARGAAAEHGDGLGGAAAVAGEAFSREVESHMAAILPRGPMYPVHRLTAANSP